MLVHGARVESEEEKGRSSNPPHGSEKMSSQRRKLEMGSQLKSTPDPPHGHERTKPCQNQQGSTQTATTHPSIGQRVRRSTDTARIAHGCGAKRELLGRAWRNSKRGVGEGTSMGRTARGSQDHVRGLRGGGDLGDPAAVADQLADESELLRHGCQLCMWTRSEKGPLHGLALVSFVPSSLYLSLYPSLCRSRPHVFMQHAAGGPCSVLRAPL